MVTKVVSIHQPNLFPRLKVLEKIVASDIYVIYDDVQFVRNDWQNRILIRPFSSSTPFWICLPVNKPHGRSSRINEVMIVETEKNFKKAYKQLYGAYSKSPYWGEIDQFLHIIFEFDYINNNNLADFLSFTIKSFLNYFSINTEIVRSSSFPVKMPKEKNMHLIEICKIVGGNAYICGSGGLSYIDKEVFNKHGIDIIVQYWNESDMEKMFGQQDWKNISFFDFWARFGADVLENYLKVQNSLIKGEAE